MPITVQDSSVVKVPYLPGLIHSNSRPVIDLDALLLRHLSKEDGVKAAMRKSSGSGMLGDKSQKQGIFADMISYGFMPIRRLQVATENKLSPARLQSMRDYASLIDLGMRPSKSTVDSWLRGYYGSEPPNDIPPRLKKDYQLELALWDARERTQKQAILGMGVASELNTLNRRKQGLNERPLNTQDWLDTLDLNFKKLEEALINPFQIDKEAWVPSEDLIRMRDLGLFRLKIPKEYGGLGLDQREYDMVLRALVRCFSGTLGGIVSAHSTIGSKPLVKYGTPEQKEAYLREIALGMYLCAFGLTEPSSGTDAIDKAETTAKKDGKSWILNGQKIFITNTHRAGLIFLLAKVDNGLGELQPTVFMVELPFRITDSKDLMNAKRKVLAKGELGELYSEEKNALESADLSESERRSLYEQDGKIIMSNPLEGNTIRGSNQAYIELHDFKIPEINHRGVKSALGEVGEGTKVIFNSLNEGRAGFGSFCAEAASGAFQLALIEAVQRPRFDIHGGTLADLPKVKQYFSEMAVRTEVLNATTDLTTNLIDTYPDMNIIAEAAAIKAFATEEAWDTAQASARIFGGMGTMKGQAIELILRDLWIPLIVEGVNEALEQHLVGVSAKPALNASKTLGGKVGLLASRFHYEKGNLSLGDAWWIQRQTKKLSFDALMLGFKNKEKTMLKQNELIDIANRAIELYAMAAVLLKLKDTSISEKQRVALRQFVENTKSGVEQYPTWISDLYIDDTIKAVSQTRKENKNLILST